MRLINYIITIIIMKLTYIQCCILKYTLYNILKFMVNKNSCLHNNRVHVYLVSHSIFIFKDCYLILYINICVFAYILLTLPGRACSAKINIYIYIY